MDLRKTPTHNFKVILFLVRVFYVALTIPKVPVHFEIEKFVNHAGFPEPTFFKR